MEAMSTSVPSINLPKIPPKPHHFHHLKSSLLLHHPHISTSTNATATVATGTSISTKPPSSSHKPYTPHQLQSTTSHSLPSCLHTHRNAASGYAAALVDAALCSNSLDAIHKDVKRLLKWLKCNEMLKGLMADPFVDEGVKGKVLKEVSEKGKLRRQVLAVVKMLVAKNKSGMVVQVMEEFEGIYRQLNCSLLVAA